VLIAVPVAAMVLAYSTRTGEAPQDAAIHMVRDIVKLLR
jgi:hypothetical protein